MLALQALAVLAWRRAWKVLIRRTIGIMGCGSCRAGPGLVGGAVVCGYGWGWLRPVGFAQQGSMRLHSTL